MGTTTFCRGVFYQRQAGIQIDVINYIAFVSRSPGYPSIDARLVEAILETRLGLSQELEVSGNATLRLAKAVAARPPIDPFEDYDASEARSDRPTAPAWQHTAPRTELRIKRDQPGVPQDGQGTGDAPSSARFAAVAAAIQSGQPLEGVREIPDRVEQPPVCLAWTLPPPWPLGFRSGPDAGPQGVTPMGTRAAPRKPWETDTGDAVGSTGIAFDSYAQMDETFPKAEEDGEGSPPLEN